jgi:hypothetical protein
LKSRKSLQLPISISIFPKIAGRPKSGKKLGTTLGRAIKKEVGNDNYALFLDQPKRIKRTSQFSASNVEDVNEINDYDDQDDVDHEPDDSDFGQDINSGKYLSKTAITMSPFESHHPAGFLALFCRPNLNRKNKLGYF